MVGKNEFILNHETLCEAVEVYLNTLILSTENKLQVHFVEEVVEDSGEFRVILSSKKQRQSTTGRYPIIEAQKSPKGASK